MTSTITAPTALDTFRVEVRQAAENYLNTGYGNREGWNKFLVHVGLEPLTTKRVVVTAKVTADVSRTFTPSGDVEAWIESNRGGLISHYDLAEQIAGVTPEIVVEDGYAPGIEGEEAHPDAATDDLRTYKRLVRREGLKLRKDNDWCEGGTSEAFEKVGLARIGSVQVPVDLTVTRRVMVTVDDAVDEEDAHQLLAEGELDEVVKAHVAYRERFVGAALPAPGSYAYGDPDPTGWGDHGNSVTRVARDGRCAHPIQVGEGDVALGCTWPSADHEGDHIAASWSEVVAVEPR